jgi:hypothetical protein
MLRAEQGHELSPGRSQSRHVTDSVRIHSGLVSYQSDPVFVDQMQAVPEQDRDPGLDPSRRAESRDRRGASSGRASDTPPQESQ